MSQPLYTIGHSNHPVERFIELLRQHQIESVVDVRSHPYSQYCAQFNRESLDTTLDAAGIRYAFFGNELGARTEDGACYQAGRVVYSRLAETQAFRAGLSGLRTTMNARRVVLMCSEKDPLTCHRMILICRQIRAETDLVRHILESGEIETQSEAEIRLLAHLRLTPSLFESEEELIELAYDRQGERIAYERPRPGARAEKNEPWL